MQNICYNFNNVFDGDDSPVMGGQFIVDNSLRTEQSGSDGKMVIGQLTVGPRMNAELKLSSLADPFLKPNLSGVSFRVRPGQMLDIPIALHPTGDVEGKFLFQTENHFSPISGAKLHFLDADGRILADAVTEYDGYFYADGLPLGDVTIEIAPETASDLTSVLPKLTLTLTPEEPSAYDIELIMNTS